MPRAAYDDGEDCVSSIWCDSVDDATATAKRWADRGWHAWARNDADDIMWDSAMDPDYTEPPMHFDCPKHGDVTEVGSIEGPPSMLGHGFDPPTIVMNCGCRLTWNPLTGGESWTSWNDLDQM
jgi:hypothetical protein